MGTTSIYHVLVDDQPLVGIIHAVEDIPLLYCAPATIDLAGAEIELVPMVAREAPALPRPPLPTMSHSLTTF